MAIRCEHVHRLELRTYFKFWAAVATWLLCRKPRLSVIVAFLIVDMHIRKQIQSLFLAQLVNGQQIVLKTYAAIVYKHVHIIWPQLLRTIKKHVFFCDLACLCRFNIIWFPLKKFRLCNFYGRDLI